MLNQIGDLLVALPKQAKSENSLEMSGFTL